MLTKYFVDQPRTAMLMKSGRRSTTVRRMDVKAVACSGCLRSGTGGMGGRWEGQRGRSALRDRLCRAGRRRVAEGPAERLRADDLAGLEDLALQRAATDHVEALGGRHERR